MAESKDKAPGAQTAGEEGAQRRTIEVNDEAAVTSYANFCRVTSAPEEVIIDFGLNAHALGTPPQGLKINQRIVVNYYNAKRLLQALHHTVQRYEATFGILETDLQKRVGTPKKS